MEKMRTKITVLTFLVLVSAVFFLIPYKFYDSVFFGGITPNSSSSIAEEFSGLFDGNWLAITFVFIFLPIVLVSEILFSKNLSSKKWKIIFGAQGLSGVLATYAMFWMMTFYIFETNVRLTPIFYLSLLLVITSSIGSIFLVIPRINDWIMKIKTI